MLNQRKAKGPGRWLNADLNLIDGGFTDDLRQRHTAEFTVALYRRFLRQVAKYLAQRGRCAAMLRRQEVPKIMRGLPAGLESHVTQAAAIRAVALAPIPRPISRAGARRTLATMVRRV